MSLPFALKPEDRADDGADDPQAVGIRLMALLREIADDATEMHRRLDGWSDDPIGTLHKTRGRALELRELALRAPEMGELLMRACRSRGVFSMAREG